MSDSSNKQIYDLSYRSIATILDSLDALVYVADMDTCELIFCNAYGRNIWGETQGKTCWKVLQQDQDGPCEFCTNNRLLDYNGQPTGVYVWEFQNTVDQRWYQCRDQAIVWVDGRLVRMEIATDITDRKLAEEKIKIAQKRAEELALKDELTGLNNRRAFFDQGHRVFKQADRYQHPVSVVMMDIDHFKNINDNHGHHVGDKVLQDIAKLLQNIVREIDIAARIGGEEFALVLPETDLSEAVNMAERLRQEIFNTAIVHQAQRLHITASFGVTTCMANEVTLETMLIRADDAMYIAKKKGRNQVKTSS